jgi:lipoprotein NlpI
VAALIAIVTLLGWIFGRGRGGDHGSQPSPAAELGPAISNNLPPGPVYAPGNGSGTISPRLGNAEALRNQGLFERDKRQDYAGAIRDFDQAIRMEPNFPETYANRGDAYLWKGDFLRAAQDYDQVLRLDPQFAQGFHRRGVIKLLLGQFRPAQEDLNLAIHSNQPNSDRPYDPIWLYLAEAKSGQNAAPDLKANAGNMNLMAWPGPVAKLFLGAATPDSVLAAARDPNPQNDNRQHCQAYYFLGEYALSHGQRASAIQLFQRSLATGQSRQFAYLLAKSELAHLRN